MNLLFPKFNWRLLPGMLLVSVIGALISGAYGVVHDQITYSISAEYFSKMKFEQFDYADFGWPVRWFVAEIGFLATWWVGFIGGWFLARIAFPVWPFRQAFGKVMRGYLIMLVGGLAGAISGYLWGRWGMDTISPWAEMAEDLGIVDVAAFTRVGYIHLAGYAGGLVGLIGAIVSLLRARKRFRLSGDAEI